MMAENPGAQGRAPSMADVAEVAGVSHQTVSRVLNDHPNVREETRAAVLAAIEQLGYRRNSAARALVTRRSGVLGVVTTGSALFGPSSTLLGIELAAREHGYVVTVATVTSFEPSTMSATVEQFLEQRVEGIIVVAPQVDATRAILDLGAPVPIVMVSSSFVDARGAGVSPVRSVSVDQVAGGRLATEHLLGLGHRNVLHVAGPGDWFDARARLVGWRAALETVPGASGEMVQGDWTADFGYDLGLRLAREGAPSAVFAANDQIALGLLRAFWESGLVVPRDVSVVGFDDVAGADHFIPPLTTVRQDFEALGRHALAVTDRMVEGEDPDTSPLVPELVVRASTTAWG